MLIYLAQKYLALRINTRNNQEKGLSLIEMIITVIIVGILAATTIPSLLGLFNQNRVTEALSEVKGAIKEAQRQAIRRGKTCKIKFDEVTIKGKIRHRVTIVTNTDEPGSNYSGCLLRERILPEVITLDTSLPGKTPRIIFSHRGNTTSSGTIALFASTQGIQKCLVISNGLGIMRTGNYHPQASGSMAKKCKYS